MCGPAGLSIRDALRSEARSAARGARPGENFEGCGGLDAISIKSLTHTLGTTRPTHRPNLKWRRSAPTQRRAPRVLSSGALRACSAAVLLHLTYAAPAAVTASRGSVPVTSKPTPQCTVVSQGRKHHKPHVAAPHLGHARPRPHPPTRSVAALQPPSPPTTKRVHDGLSCVGTGIIMWVWVCMCVLHTGVRALPPIKAPLRPEALE